MARGNNVYNSTSNAAQSGPGGPDMGRPPLVPPAALAAIRQRVGMPQAPQPQVPTQPYTPQQNKAVGNFAQAAMQMAAQRRMQRS